MARVNYQRDKRLRDLDRQRRQEEKRQRKLNRGQGGEPGVEAGQPGTPVEGDVLSEAEGAPEADRLPGGGPGDE